MELLETMVLLANFQKRFGGDRSAIVQQTQLCVQLLLNFKVERYTFYIVQVSRRRAIVIRSGMIGKIKVAE